MPKPTKRPTTRPRPVRFSDADWALVQQAARVMGGDLHLTLSGSDFIRRAAVERAKDLVARERAS